MISPEQRQLRRKGIGSSDAAAVLHLDPYRSAYDVWLEKSGRADDFGGNEATDRGNLLEPVLINWCEHRLQTPLTRNVFITSPDHPHLLANLDAEGPGYIVEAKTSANAAEWGEEGTDQVPERVIVQTHHAMLLRGVALAYVPVLLPVYGRLEFRMYEVPRNDDLAEAIGARGRQFWETHVLADSPPTDSKPSLEVLKRIRREPAKVVPVADEIVDNWIVAKAAAKQAADDLAETQAALLAAMGEAEGASFAGGMVTYYEQHRKGFTVAATSYRTLRLSKAGK